MKVGGGRHKKLVILLVHKGQPFIFPSRKQEDEHIPAFWHYGNFFVLFFGGAVEKKEVYSNVSYLQRWGGGSLVPFSCFIKDFHSRELRVPASQSGS